MKNIEIRRWTVIDVYYNDKDTKKAKKIVAQYEAKGYVLEHEDSGSNIADNCDQLIYPTIITKR